MGVVNRTERIVSCEKYDIQSKKWDMLLCLLPFPIKSASAVVDRREKYCFISNGMITRDMRTSIRWKPSNGLIIFNQDDGFKYHESVFRINIYLL